MFVYICQCNIQFKLNIEPNAQNICIARALQRIKSHLNTQIESNDSLRWAPVQQQQQQQQQLYNPTDRKTVQLKLLQAQSGILTLAHF